MENQTLQFYLIDGQFATGDAKDILNALFTQKINYHKLKNFSHEERYGISDERSVKRLEELKRDKTTIIQFLDGMNKNEYLEIKSQVIVTVKQRHLQEK